MPHYSESYPEGLFEAIKPDFEAAYDDHHTKVQREGIALNPYEMVPLDDYEGIRAEYEQHLQRWAERGIDLRPVIEAVLIVDTATEDNLPWYTAQISDGFPEWQDWNGRWTAEERSHGEIMQRDMEARGFDMDGQWQHTREQNLRSGIHVKIASPADGVSYVAVQELLTRDAHMRSARLMDDAGRHNLLQIGADEGRHYQFYRRMLSGMATHFPDYTLAAFRRQHEASAFAMPGQKGIPGFARMAKLIGASGVFDAETVIAAQARTIKEAGLLDAEPRTNEGKLDQEWAAETTDESSEQWQKRRRAMEILRTRQMRQADEAGELRPFILGETVELDGNKYKLIET